MNTRTPSPSPDPPANLHELQVALSLDDVPGPLVAAWRDQYVEQDEPGPAMVELCVEELHSRKLCYSCGLDADRLVNGEFPWVCRGCEDLI